MTRAHVISILRSTLQDAPSPHANRAIAALSVNDLGYAVFLLNRAALHEPNGDSRFNGVIDILYGLIAQRSK